MDFNKKRCKKLKEIRKSIADKLGVDLQQKECTFEGKCSGTCPKCKQEEEILNKALLKRTGAIGIAATMGASLVGCNFLKPDYGQLAGDVRIADPPKPTIQEELLEGEILDDPNILGGLEYMGDDEENDKYLEECERLENELKEKDYELTGLVAPPIDEEDLEDIVLMGDVEYTGDED